MPQMLPPRSLLQVHEEAARVPVAMLGLGYREGCTMHGGKYVVHLFMSRLTILENGSSCQKGTCHADMPESIGGVISLL